MIVVINWVNSLGFLFRKLDLLANGGNLYCTPRGLNFPLPCPLHLILLTFGRRFRPRWIPHFSPLRLGTVHMQGLLQPVEVPYPYASLWNNPLGPSFATMPKSSLRNTPKPT